MPHPQLNNNYNRPQYQTNVRTTTPNNQQQQGVVRSTVIQGQVGGGGGVSTATSATPLTVTASPQRAPQRRGSKGGPAAAPPPKQVNLLDYAMEKAGIPSSIIQIHGQGLGPGGGNLVKSDAELLGLAMAETGTESGGGPAPSGATKVTGGDFDLEVRMVTLSLAYPYVF